MPNLFGQDIAKIVNDALGSGLLDATLTKVTGTTRQANRTGGTVESTTSHTCKGVMEDYTARQIDGTIVQVGDRRVLLLGASISPAAVPEANDRITIEGETLYVLRVERDPAAAAYVCQVRKR